MTIDPGISEWGNPARWTRAMLNLAGERGELKHLITRRRRKQNVIPPVVASERGRAQTAAVSATAGSWDREIRRKTKCNYLER